MAAIHGANIRIYNGTTLIGGQKNVTINIKSDTVETHTKSDYPNKSYKYSWVDWDCSFDGVLVDNTMATAILAGTTVSVVIQDNTTTTAASLYSGTALLTEFSCEASQDDVATFSCSLQGTGALTVTAITSSSSNQQVGG